MRRNYGTLLCDKIVNAKLNESSLEEFNGLTCSSCGFKQWHNQKMISTLGTDCYESTNAIMSIDNR